MRVVRDVDTMQGLVELWRRNGERVGFVPTMGALHEGHLSLVRKACGNSKRVIVSIFVNPLQFGPEEDFGRYPRDEERDLEILNRENVDVAFMPDSKELYPEGFETKVVPGRVARDLEGAFRPGHFSGVCTVVLKLFCITNPHEAWFGAKDAQQLAVVKRMVKDFNLPIRIRVGPTVREKDGLAMSSRNEYLSAREREVALHIPRALFAGKALHEKGERKGRNIIDAGWEVIRRAGPELKMDYLDIRDPETFQPVADPVESGVFLAAGRVGGTRLIDNVPLGTRAEALLGEREGTD